MKDMLERLKVKVKKIEIIFLNVLKFKILKNEGKSLRIYFILINL